MDLEHRPQAINQVASQLLPAAILLFSGLKRAYACRAEHENEEDDDEEDGEEEDDNGKMKIFILLNVSKRSALIREVMSKCVILRL